MPFAWLWCLALCATLSAADPLRPYRLLVLHTNDMHSHFDQIDRTGAQCVTADDDESSRCYGGFARVKTAADRARADASSDGGGTLFLNAGDTFQGTAFYTYLKWPAVARMIRPLGIDAMVSLIRPTARVFLFVFFGYSEDFFFSYRGDPRKRTTSRYSFRERITFSENPPPPSYKTHPRVFVSRNLYNFFYSESRLC